MSSELSGSSATVRIADTMQWGEVLHLHPSFMSRHCLVFLHMQVPGTLTFSPVCQGSV